MPDSHRSQRGVPLPGLWQVCGLTAALAAIWLVWSEFHLRISPPLVDSERDAGAKLRATLRLANEGQAGLDQLVISLESDDRSTRRNALLALAELGEESQPALNAIRLRLSDPDSFVRQMALLAVSKVCDDPQQILTTAAGLLADSESEVRQSASRYLQTAGPAAIPALVAMASSDSDDARLLVVQLLTSADEDRDPGEVNAVLRRLMDDPDRAVRLQAITAVIARGAADLDDVRGRLRDEDPKVAAAGLGAVSTFGPESVAILPELQALLEDDSGTLPVPLAALAAVASLKSAARPLVPVLLKRRAADNPSSRFYVAKTLAEIDADPKDVVPILVALLTQKDDYNVCWQAGELLARIDPEEGRRQVSRLTGELATNEASLDGKDPNVQALFGLRTVAQQAVPLLIRWLSHPDGHVRSMGMATLHGIGPDAAPAVPALLALVNREPSGVSRALGGIGPAARPAVLSLLELLNGDPRETHRKDDIVRALGQIGCASPEVLAALQRQITMTAFQSSAGPIAQEPRTRVLALQSFVVLAGDSATTLAVVLPLLDDNEPGIRMQAALALGSLASDRPKVIGRLIDVLADRNHYLRTTAALALGQIGSEASAALPGLRKLLDDSRNHAPNFTRKITTRSEIGYPGVELSFIPDEIDLQMFSVAKAAQRAITAIERRD